MLEVNKIYNMDCIDGMKLLDDNSIDAIVTDPPYGLGFMGKEWDIYDKTQFGVKGNEGNNDLKVKKNFNVLPRYRSDNSFYEFNYTWAKEALRVLKPGGYLLSFGGTRTYHRMTCAIEDAGFEIRDMINWIYGSGFPKSLNIGKAIDKLQGNEREIICKNTYSNENIKGKNGYMINDSKDRVILTKTRGHSKFEGWGTALKPANEPICMARKPLSEKTVAENVLKYGTGGINIDECRIESELPDKRRHHGGGIVGAGSSYELPDSKGELPSARFPANVIHDGSDEVLKLFPVTTSEGHWAKTKVTGFGKFGNGKSDYFGVGEKDKSKGSAARFFYCAKASKSERNAGLAGFEEQFKAGAEFRPNHLKKALNGANGNPFGRWDKVKNIHPTVKPLKLMQYLVRLVTPKDGIVLDPFMGSGTTGMAAKSQGYNYIGFDITKEYCDIAEARINNICRQTKL